MEFERSRTAIFRSRTAIQRTRAPGIAIRTAIQETRRRGYVPRRSGYVSRSVSWTTRAFGKTSWAPGKPFSRSDSFPRRRTRQFPRRGPLFSRRDGIKSPGQENQGFGRPKLEPGWLRGRFSRCIKPAWSILPPWARPWKASAAQKRRRALIRPTTSIWTKMIAPLDLSVQGPQDNREPRSRRTGPLLRQAASKLTTAGCRCKIVKY
jgi:hypothetical protein